MTAFSGEYSIHLYGQDIASFEVDHGADSLDDAFWDCRALLPWKPAAYFRETAYSVAYLAIPFFQVGHS